MQRMRELTSRTILAIHDVLASAEHGVVMMAERWEREGRTLELNRVFIYHLRDGQIAEAWAYDEDQRAVDEFWA